MELRVPEELATVTRNDSKADAVAEATRHAMVVPLVHDDVAQSTDATVAVGVRSVDAKARPLSVAVRPPEEGALRVPTRIELTAGAEKTS